MAKPRIATGHFTGCFGAMSLLDIDERILDLGTSWISTSRRSTTRSDSTSRWILALSRAASQRRNLNSSGVPKTADPYCDGRVRDHGRGPVDAQHRSLAVPEEAYLNGPTVEGGSSRTTRIFPCCSTRCTRATKW